MTPPLFPGTPLAQKIEAAEAEMLAESAAAVARRGVINRALAGGVATWVGPASPFNKVAGLGFGGPLDTDALAEVEDAFFARDSAVQIELCNLADPAVGALLTRRGYVLTGFENVLGLALPPARPLPVAAAVTISESGPEEMDHWLDVVMDGFAHPDGQGTAAHEEFPRTVLQEALAAMASTGKVRRYLARRAGEIAGGASLRLSGEIAQLSGSATLPDHRRQGVQSSLLAVRLGTAAAAGCALAVVTTAPGSKSQENVQRLGFQLLYTRAVLVREAGAVTGR